MLVNDSFVESQIEKAQIERSNSLDMSNDNYLSFAEKNQGDYIQIKQIKPKGIDVNPFKHKRSKTSIRLKETRKSPTPVQTKKPKQLLRV